MEIVAVETGVEIAMVKLVIVDLVIAILAVRLGPSSVALALVMVLQEDALNRFLGLDPIGRSSYCHPNQDKVLQKDYREKTEEIVNPTQRRKKSPYKDSDWACLEHPRP